MELMNCYNLFLRFTVSPWRQTESTPVLAETTHVSIKGQVKWRITLNACWDKIYLKHDQLFQP